MFSEDRPLALPRVKECLGSIKNWVESVVEGRLHFYSAREEPGVEVPKTIPKKAGQHPKKMTNAMLAEQVASLMAQVQLLSARQDAVEPVANGGGDTPKADAVSHAGGPKFGPTMAARLPALSDGLRTGTVGPQGALNLVGPPPRTKQQMPFPKQPATPAIGSGGALDSGVDLSQQTDGGIALAIAQQSMALTALVSHLAGGDPMHDLASGSSGGPSLNTKGVARRERMQASLADRSSTYFMQVQQQLFKRMHPARTVPQDLSTLQSSGVSMTSYLEKYGGYRNSKDTGLALWILAHCMDSAAAGDFEGTKEYLALLTVCLEQSALDGNWNVAFILSLLEDPPVTLFAERMNPVATLGRPFSPLVPPSWAACALSYLKEIEVLTVKKSEMKAKGAPPKQPGANEETPSPKRKAKFLKRPKAPPADRAEG